MTDFSFVSVEVGIPFATSEGALIIYDCNDASRYVAVHYTLIGLHAQQRLWYLAPCLSNALYQEQVVLTIRWAVNTRSWLVARMEKSKGVHRNDTYEEVMPVAPHEACALNRMRREEDIYKLRNNHNSCLN